MSCLERIPAELQALNQWVLWRLEERDGKPTKAPYRVREPFVRASSTDSATWAPFELAVQVAHQASGIGFVFTKDDPYCGADLDLELSQGDRAAIALQLASYTEESVSGGWHVIMRASLNGHGRHPQGIGLFDAGRYFVMTGKHVAGTPWEIAERQAELEAVLAEYLPVPDVHIRNRALENADVHIRTQPVDLDDRELLARAFAAKNGGDFQALWGGSWEGRYSSHSEADLALCASLAFWTGRDVERMDRLFRSSGLYREKWEREDYRGRTIEAAVAGTSETFQSSRPRRDAVGARTASSSSEKGKTATASPRPDVVGTRDGTRHYSDDVVSLDLRFVPADAFASQDEAGAAALVGDDDNVLVPEGGDVMFYGDGGAGKTTLMIDLALHLAAGDDWLGIRVGRPIRVGIVENEGPRPLFRAKLRRKLGAWQGSPVGDRLLVHEEPWSKVSLDERVVRETLAAKIAELE